jgi:Cu/Ag efflux pump CusA
LVGGVFAVFATDGLLSLGGMVGFITLFGITLRNSILMIAHYEHLVEVVGMNWSLDTALRGAADRLTPILMTSIVTGLGVLPLAIDSGIERGTRVTIRIPVSIPDMVSHGLPGRAARTPVHGPRRVRDPKPRARS